MKKCVNKKCRYINRGGGFCNLRPECDSFIRADVVSDRAPVAGSVSDELKSLVDETAKLPEPNLEALAKRNCELAEDPNFKRMVSERMKQNSGLSRD